MQWWSWIVAGVVLLGVELLIIDAQFFLVFLGLAAIVVGIAALAGLGGPDWVQWLLFGVLALIFTFGFRTRVYQKLRGNAPGFDDGLAGHTLSLPDGLSPGAEGRIEFRGSTWRVVNAGSEPIPAGAKARIVSTEGLTLRVEPLQSVSGK
jgi:membrane protein implicated in regulation of membrane protease activity